MLLAELMVLTPNQPRTDYEGDHVLNIQGQHLVATPGSNWS